MDDRETKKRKEGYAPGVYRTEEFLGAQFYMNGKAFSFVRINFEIFLVAYVEQI